MSDANDDMESSQVHEAMLEALEPIELDAERRATLKRRLIARIDASLGSPASNAKGQITIRADDGDWQPFLPKVTMKVLMREGSTLSYLLRLEPGARIPPHDHPQTEECVVLSGEAQIGDLTVHAGDYHVAQAGHPHGLLSSATGALLFLRGEVPAAKQLHWSDPQTYAALIPDALRGLVQRSNRPK
jgi:mannose-6-phosphate isomerase-like protein (cupin superfamily)